MYFIASFEQTIFLELAVTALEQSGIRSDEILAVPLDKRQEPRQLFDTIHRADGVSLFDLAAVLGTCGMLLGAIYGMVLTWGPILWGLIGLVSGVLIGFLIRLWFAKRHEAKPAGSKKISAEVFLMVHCQADQGSTIETILWDNLALGIAKLNLEHTTAGSAPVTVR
jgi:hypothetical protein